MNNNIPAPPLINIFSSSDRNFKEKILFVCPDLFHFSLFNSYTKVLVSSS